MLSFWITSFLFAFPFFFEGIGFTVYQTGFLLYYLALPAILFFFFLSRNPKLYVPAKPVILTAAFTILTGISAFVFSVDKQTSVEQFAYYLSLGLIFLYTYNNKTAVGRAMSFVIPGLGVVFVSYALFIHRVTAEKQVVFPTYGSHNHLGDFVGLALIILLALKMEGWRRLVQIGIAVFFITAIIFSYSRSAYVALGVVLVLYLVNNRRHLSRILLYSSALTISLLLLLLSLTSSRRINKNSFLYPVQDIAIKRLGLLPRDILDGRETFFTQAVVAIKKHPVFGLGGGNFIQASLFNNGNNFTDTAHNILLDVAAEQGLPAALVFLGLIYFLFRPIWRKNSVWGFALIYLIINFQTDYTYKILLFPVLAAVMAALEYDDEKRLSLPSWLYGLSSLSLFVVMFCIMTSFVLLELNRPNDALLFYPLQKQAYIQAIDQADTSDKAIRLIRAAYRVAGNDAELLSTGAKNAYRFGMYREALQSYEHMYQNNPFVSLETVKQIYFLKRQTISKQNADAFLHEVALTYQTMKPVNEDLMREFGSFCYQNTGSVCKETGWLYPKL